MNNEELSLSTLDTIDEMTSLLKEILEDLIEDGKTSKELRIQQILQTLRKTGYEGYAERELPEGYELLVDGDDTRTATIFLEIVFDKWEKISYHADEDPKYDSETYRPMARKIQN